MLQLGISIGDNRSTRRIFYASSVWKLKKDLLNCIRALLIRMKEVSSVENVLLSKWHAG
jgi:hypothetical protein